MRRRDALLGAAALAAAYRAAADARQASTALPSVQVLPDAVEIPGLRRRRTLRLCLPPSYAREPTRRYPLVVLHDAQNLFDAITSFAGEWGVDEAMDTLAAATGFEALVVGIDHGGERRVAEMLPRPHGEFRQADGDAYADFVVHTLLPWVAARYRVREGAEHAAIGGSSMGAVISQHLLQRHPGRFGKALLFSPAYWVAPSLFEQAAAQPLPAGSRVAWYAGGSEGSTMVPLVERMQALVRAQGTATRLHVEPQGRHNEAAWRAALPQALRWLFDLG
ncbi:MAG TPA: alpha/beta hydrolase-fold protein [Burkholderiaceae bacterium]|nr:alpha/beta hydrolase-fold protein [Burkholderiaceae bacterium]